MAFLFTFLVGAAWAAATGTLTINAGVTVVMPQDVVWETAIATDSLEVAPVPFGMAIGNTAQDVDGVGTKILTWDITFYGAGTAILSATAENRGSVDVDITSSDFEWSAESIAGIDALGITVDIDDMFFLGPLDAGDSTIGYTIISVNWDGTVADDAPDGMFEQADYDQAIFTAQLTITFYYEAA